MDIEVTIHGMEKITRIIGDEEKDREDIRHSNKVIQMQDHRGL